MKRSKLRWALSILGLLAVIAVPQVIRYLGESRTSAASIQIQSLGSVLDLYHLDVGRYPTQAQGLEVLVTRPAGVDRWNGPYLKTKGSLIDPWGKTYDYRTAGSRYVVLCEASDEAKAD